MESSGYNINDAAVLGTGGHGTVLAAVHAFSQKHLACKIVPLQPYSQYETNEVLAASTNTSPSRKIFREFQVLKNLDHPNIARLEKVFKSRFNVYIFQELFTGGDLFSYVDAHPRGADEADAAVMLLQIMKGVEYLHGQNIVHRDLKPDNILLTSATSSPRVVLTDFGHARHLPTDEVLSAITAKRMYSACGTFEYTAP